MTAAALAVEPTITGSADDLNHVYCCDPDVALCGTDISGDEEVEYDTANCVVCLDLEDAAVACSPTCPTGAAA